MKNFGQIEALAVSDAPTRTERILADRKAQLLRATTNQMIEQIPCPGQCGGVALLVESPLSVTRGGVTRTIRVAQCQDKCQMESRIGRTGKTRLVPARFEVPWGNDAPTEPLESAIPGGASPEISAIACTEFRGGQRPLSMPTNGLPSSLAADKPIEKGCEKEPIVLNTAPSPEEYQQPKPLLVSDPPREYEEVYPPEAVDDSLSSEGQPEVQSGPHALSPSVPNPYEAVLRSLLEPAAQRHLEQIAGTAAEGITVRVSLEWERPFSEQHQGQQ